MILERYEVDQLAQRLKALSDKVKAGESVAASDALAKDLAMASAITYNAGEALGGYLFGPGFSGRQLILRS